MAYDNKKVAWQSVGFAANVPRIIIYENTDDLIATIAASAYFNNLIDLLRLNDLVWCVGSDAPHLYYVSSVTTNVELTQLV